jgi:hypothetical protein
MGKRLGQSLGAQTDTIGMPDADDSTSAGDAVAIGDTDIEAGDGSAGDELLGVRSDGRQAGDEAGVHVRGITLATVAAGVTAGTDLDLVDTSVADAPAAGTLIATAGGRAHALSDEGGEWKGESLDANEAAVLVR